MKNFIYLLIAVITLSITTPTYVDAAPQRSSKSYKSKTVHVKGYTTKKGHYVAPHYRSRPSKRK